MQVTRRKLLVGSLGLASAPAIRPAVADQAPAVEKAPGMKLGMISYNVAKDWSLPVLIANCKAAGFEGVELRTTHAHGVEPTLGAAARKEVRSRFSDTGIVLWGLGTVCEFQSPDAAVVRENVESCKRWCELAHDVGAHGVKVRPNGLPDPAAVDKTLVQIGDALRECGRAAEAQGVEVWLEVHGSGTAHPPHIRTILDRCGHPKVGACWNSNASDLVNGSVKQYFELLRPDIRSCHINDLWDTSYPYRELFALFRKSGYDRFTLCEVGTPVHAEDGPLFMRCYRGLWRELQHS